MKILSDNILRNFKNSFLFFLPSIFAMCIQLFSTPIFARNLSSYDYSVMGYFGAIQKFFLPVLNLSLFPYYMRGYHKRTKNENMIVINSMIIFLSITNLVTLSFGIAGISIYFKYADVSFPLFPYILFSLFSSYFTIYISTLTMNYKMQKKGIQFALIRSVYPVLSIGIGLLFVVGFQWGAKGRMSAILIGHAVIGIYAFIKLFKKNINFDFNIIKNALKLGYPLIIMAFLEFPIQSIDKIFLERLDDVNTFALYNIGLRFAGILMVFGGAMFKAFEPDFYKFIDKKEWKKLIIIVIAVFGLLVVANVTFNLFSKPVVDILTSGRYTNAYHYADITVWANLFLKFSFFLAIFFVIYNRTKLLLLNQIILAILAIIIYLYAINHWQFYGAAWARVTINALNVFLMIIFLLFILFKKGKLERIKNVTTNYFRNY